MKKIILLSAAMAVFAACTNEEVTNITEQSQKNQMIITAEKSPVVEGESDGSSLFRTSVSNVSTAPAFYWKPGDVIGIRKINNGTFAGAAQNHPFAYTGTGENTDNISGGTFAKIGSTSFSAGDHIGYYPYSEAALTAGNMQFDLPCQIQEGNASYTNFGSCDFMYSNVVNLTANQIGNALVKTNSGITFTHAMAFLQFDITGLTPGDILYQIELAGPKDCFKRSLSIKPDGTADYVSPTQTMVLFTKENGENGYTVQSDGEYHGWLVVGASVPAGAQLDIYYRTDKGCFKATTSYTAGANGFRTGYLYKLISRNMDEMTLVSNDKWDGATYSLPYIDGTNILIRTPFELAWVAGVCNKTITGAEMEGVTNSTFEGYTITLGNNINLGQAEWTPIGINNTGKTFAGTFDGQGKLIQNLKISSGNNVGLFGFTSASAVIKNVVVNSSVSINGGPNVAAIVAQNAGRVEGCNANNCKINGGSGNNTGGIAGVNAAAGRIINCKGIYDAGQISGTGNVGGIAGRNDGTVENCTVSGKTKIAGTSTNIGGIVGYNNGGKIVACVNSAPLDGRNYIGGIAGDMTGTIAVCYNAATALTGGIATAAIGGIAGQQEGGVIISCASDFIPSNPLNATINGFKDGAIVGVANIAAGASPTPATCYTTVVGYVDGIYEARLIGTGFNALEYRQLLSSPTIISFLNNSTVPQYSQSVDGGSWSWKGDYGKNSFGFKK